MSTLTITVTSSIDFCWKWEVEERNPHWHTSQAVGFGVARSPAIALRRAQDAIAVFMTDYPGAYAVAPVTVDGRVVVLAEPLRGVP